MPEVAELEMPTPTSPDALTIFQNDARAQFAESIWPERNDERWRFANLKQTSIEGFEPTAVVEQTIEGATADVEVLTLKEAFVKHPERVRDALRTIHGDLGAETYIAKAKADVNLDGTVIIVPKGVELTEPIIIDREIHGENASASLFNVVIAEAQSKVTVFERLHGYAPQVVIGGAVVLAGDGSEATFAQSQELSLDSKFIHASYAKAGRDATSKILLANFGGGWVRQEATAKIESPGSDVELYGFNIANNDQEFDQRTYQHHLCGNARSNLLFKNALYHRAKTIFSGLIHVEQEAHHTDSFQTCRNLLLSDEAEAHSMPGLEINADQVSCSHGATAGQMDPEELFYLRARGIPEERAQQLATIGFANEVFAKVGCLKIEETLVGLVEDQLKAMRD